ncbi:MAG: glycosyltransferase family 2 protein [Flavobacteriales bacterium]
MDVSVIIPLLNEEESLAELHAWLKRVFEAQNWSHEIVFIDDGSKDSSWLIIQELKAKDPNVKGVKFLRNYGKSAALNVGFKLVKGRVVFTMDADLQDSPDELPEMYRMITEDHLDLVSGWKQKRHDPISKTIPTKLYNWATRKMSGIKLNDFNCGLKAYRNPVVKAVEVHGEMHRYIPVMAKQKGFDRIGEKPVAHQARKYGVTKFGLERFSRGFLDLLTISFISRFGKRPMHLFGTWGTFMFLIGFLGFIYIGGSKLYSVYYLKEAAKNIADISTFYISLTAMILGTQLFLAGFLGELISRNEPGRNNYQIEEQI